MQRRSAFAAFALGLFLLAGCSGGDGSVPDACATHADCAESEVGSWCTTEGDCVACITTLHCEAGLVCDAESNTCVECRTTADCDSGVCDPDSNACVTCLADADCGDWSVCDTEAHTCTELCATDADCEGDPAGPACDRTTGACTTCLHDGHCGVGEQCDTEAGACVAGACTQMLDCLGHPSGPNCDAATGHCVWCFQDSDCGDIGDCVNGQCVSTMACESDVYCQGSVCDEAAGVCVGCLADADCGGTRPVCDTVHGWCVACGADADCDEGDVCDRSTGRCESCATDANCADPDRPSCTRQSFWGFNFNVCGCLGDEACQDPSLPFCSNGTRCVECRSNDDCKDPDSPFCSGGVCNGCLSEDDCSDPAAPACVPDPDTGVRACGHFDACVGADAGEPGDDGRSGAFDLTAGFAGEPVFTLTLDDRSICSAPNGNELDWYRFDVVDGDAATLTVTWTEAVDVGVYVYGTEEVDGVVTLVPFGVSPPAQPARVALTYLPAGAYYALVVRHDGSTSTVDPTASTPYTLAFERAASPACSSPADCGAEWESQYFRGECAASGACVEIAGQGGLAPGSLCDSHDDCAGDRAVCNHALSNSSGSLNVWFTAEPHLRSFCVDGQCAADSDCGEGQVCELGFCFMACTSDDHCFVDLTRESAAGWPRWTCNLDTGHCE